MANNEVWSLQEYIPLDGILWKDTWEARPEGRLENSRWWSVVWVEALPMWCLENCLQVDGHELPLNLGTVHSDIDSVRIGSGKINPEVFFHLAFNLLSEFCCHSPQNKQQGVFPRVPHLGRAEHKGPLPKVPALSVLLVRKENRNSQTVEFGHAI